jgi:hypothetical protein
MSKVQLCLQWLNRPIVIISLDTAVGNYKYNKFYFRSLRRLEESRLHFCENEIESEIKFLTESLLFEFIDIYDLNCDL